MNDGTDTNKPKGKVADVDAANQNKLVKAGDLATALNKLSWTATAGKDGTGEVDPENPTEQEVKAGDKVTFKAGNNLKVKQSGKDFTYSLKEELTGLTSITLGKTGTGANGATTKITSDGLTITPATGANNANISVTTSGISAGDKAITNVASGLKTYENTQNGAPTVGGVNEAKKDLVNLDTPVAGNGAGTTVAESTAATVGDLRGLGWVLSAEKTTDDDNAGAFHAAVKNANEVEFKGKGSATVSAKSDSGKYVVTVDVAETQVGDGLEKDNGKIKLKVDDTNTNNVLTVSDKGASVTKGTLEVVGASANGDKKGQVKAKGADGNSATDTDKSVATVKSVADAINSVSTFVKAESTTDDIEDTAANGTNDTEEALKAGDTLTFKAGKNLKVKHNGKSITFDLAKNLEAKTATFSDRLTIGGNTDAGGTATPKVDITSTSHGLNFAKNGAMGDDANVYLNGIASTLTDTLLNGGAATNLDGKGIKDDEKKRAASVKDVLNAGWNVRGVKPTSTDNTVENIDFVATYDTVEFVSKDNDTTSVTVENKENGKKTEVKIGAKTSVIKEKDGKLVTGKELKTADNAAAITEEEGKDEGKGLVTAKTVIEAVNKAGWRIKTTGTAAGQDGKFETVASGTNVTFADGQGTTAEVTKDDQKGITVKYNANVGDGLTIGNDQKIVADTTKLTVNDGTDTNKPKGKVADVAEADKKKLVNAGDLATALNDLSWTAKAGVEDGGEADNNNPANGQEVKAGETVTFKAGNNLKVKQSEKDFTYSLQDSLTGLKDITLNKASDGTTNGATTKITNEGLTITPANGANNANTISVTKDGISAGNKAITNVKSGLNAYGNTNAHFDATANSAADLNRQFDANGAYNGLLNLNEKGAGKNLLVADGTAATVGDLRKLGWVVSTKNGNNEKSYQVKQADEVLFTGAGAATVSSSSKDGKHTITVSVAETKANSGLEKDSDTIKLKVDKNTNNVLTVSDSGTAVTKGEFNTVDTSVPAENATTETKANRGKVTVNGVTDLTKATETDKKKVATVIDVATAINSAATFVKTENLTTALDEDNPTDDGSDDALKAGDTLTFKAGKNLKVKRSGKEITFDLAKNLEAKTATFSDKLSIGSGANAVDITNENGGLKLAKGAADIQLRGIGSTLTDTITGTTTKAENGVAVANHNLAASVKDVLSAGWNIRGATTAGGNTEDVDFVRTYDTVEFVSGNTATTDVTVEAKDGGKRTVVTITAKNDVGSITTTEGGKVVVGTDGQASTEPGAKDKVAKTGDVVEAINKSGFTLKTSATTAADNLTADTLKNKGELINPGKAVEMVAGKNLTVKQEENGKVTYAIKDDVEFATVKVGEDKGGKKPVNFTTEKATDASNNDAANKPTTALKISSDGKPAQLVGVASVLNTSEVSTKPNGDKKADGKPAESKTEKLIDLAGTDAASVNKNAAATVGDLQNMGWVVSTQDGNGYTDVVKNANKVDFKGGNGIEVRGSTAADGTRVITVSAKGGKVTNKVEITKQDDSKVDAVIIDGKYYERDENGKPKTEILAADIKSADNGGSGFVTGNTVANAINDSGWNVGLANEEKAKAAFADNGKALSDSNLEKVNPDDNLRFANGKNTKVKAATVDEINKDGRKITNTYVKFDVELPIGQIENVSRDAEGNAVKKVGDKWYPADQVNEDGTLKNPATALSDEEVEKVVTGNVAAIDPEKGGKYKSANQVEKGLTTVQMGELATATEAAKLKIENLLKNQPKDVIDAAVKAAQDEAKAQYLKEKGLDKGMGGTVISNLGRGTAPGDAVNVDQLQNSGWNLDSKVVKGSSGKVISGNVSPSKVKMDETVNIDAGNNIEITRNGKNIGIATSMTPQFSSVSLGAGADAPTLSVDDEGALNVGSKDANKPVRITNVAPGVKDGDVTNVAQLKGVAQNLNNRIDNVDGNARAGIAQAIATAGLAQAYLPGKSMMAIGGGTYRGEAGYAIGYSSISDTGNWVVKGTASGNSRGHFGASTSVGYQW